MLYILIICLGVCMFGPALVSAVGALLSGVFFVVAIVLTAPAVLLVAHRDMKESDRIYDEMQDALEKGAEYRAIILKEQLDESERRVRQKIQAVYIVMILVLTALLIYATVS